MSGVSNFLSHYEFLNLTQSVTESQIALYKQPDRTWSDVGKKVCKISYYNGLSIASVGADVVTYLAVSALRSCGLFIPPLPAPPPMPSPHDNAQFIDRAVQRAVWDWKADVKEEILEGIESNFSDKWNVFQVVGEWSFAYSLENAHRGSYYKPTFLTISEPLASGASFQSVSKDFEKLGGRDKNGILSALYHQTKPEALSSKGEKLYKEIRSIASKLHQGNQNYLKAYSEYIQNRLTAASASSSIPGPAPVRESMRASAPLSRPTPSAPPLPDVPDFEVRMAQDVKFLREAVLNAPSMYRLRMNILSDTNASLLENSPKMVLAKLALLLGLKKTYRENKISEAPDFLPWNMSLLNGKTFQFIGQEFSLLQSSDFTRLEEAILNHSSRSLDPLLRQRLEEIEEFAEMLVWNLDFLKAYDALRIDLLAD